MELRNPSFPRAPFLVFLLLALGIVVAGGMIFRHETTHARKATEEHLSSIADLKASQIANWRKERIADANSNTRNPLNSLRIRPFLESASPGERGDDLRDWMESLRRTSEYHDVVLLDRNGRVRLSVGPSPPFIGAYASPNVAEVLRSLRPTLSDIHRLSDWDFPHMDLYIPLLSTGREGKRTECIGMMMIRIDPDRFLYPQIQSWPVPSATAETLLVRRDGDNVVFLNELRHRKGTTLSLRFPLSDSLLPAAAAVGGRQGIMEGIDYRGVPVVAALRPIPDSAWHIVAKVDQTEVVAPLRVRTLVISSATGLLILISGLGFLLWWKRNEARHFRTMYAAEEARRESERIYRELFENNPNPMWVYDRDTLRFLAVNDVAVSHYGYSREEFLGMTIENIRLPADVPALRKSVRDVSGTIRKVGTWRHLRKNGDIIDVEITTHDMEFGGRSARLVLATDVTERKRAEAARDTLEKQLAETLRMESIGRLAGGVAHDFNNLLVVILGHAELLLNRPEAADPSVGDSLREILKAGERAANLTRQLLAFGRKQVLTIKTIDLNRVIAGFEGMITRLIRESIEVTTHLAPDLGSVKADPFQIEQILLNLCINARDAMPDGGRLTIETTNVSLDEEYAKSHTGVRPGPYVMLAVSDSGSGMDAETVGKIFDPFYTTKEKGKGTGLGLSTVYGIVKQHGGNIWVYSEPGRGTTLKVYLPRVAEPAEEEETAPPAFARASREPETVLVVEDDESVRDLVCRILSGAGYNVLVARGGHEALVLAREAKAIHLLLTDVIMPEMSGRVVADRVATFHPGVKVLYMSGYTDNVVAHHGILEEGVHFLQKPFTAQSLAVKVRKTLEG
ncbi:MAG: sensor hybrid histidine kinase [Deltaproteobacteria bacterium]|nr:sensor hybrid histidine kinase [Deltaproteobacteria bacterium]MBS1243722.1 sensor hybrid histidine kinase [Deltaproteobacteria bacterium]